MKRSSLSRLVGVTLWVAPLLAQKASSAPAPIPMPADRISDSYSIYSSLIPLGETAANGWPHQLWLIQDSTITAVTSDQPCAPAPSTSASDRVDMGMNPHSAVHPPKDQQQNYDEILQDFDRHCHDRLSLDPNAWKLSEPVHLLTPDEQKEFQTTRFKGGQDSAMAAKYKGAPALYGFSEVYFNAHHTVALVYATHWCGGLCGQGLWIAFALRDGLWKPLQWAASTWIS
jgi:hypothetical protein